MAIQINDPFARGVGGQVGEQFSNMLTSGLQQIAQSKMQQISQRNQAKVFQQAGYPEEAANLVAQFGNNPETQFKLLEALGALSGPRTQEQTTGIPTQQQVQQQQATQQAPGQELLQQPQQRMQPTRSAAQALGMNSVQQQRLNLAQQKQINSSNAPWLKENDKAYNNARSALDQLNEMEELLNTGKVAYGISGKYKPGFLQNTETQQFDKASNTLAGLLASGQGVSTGFKIKFAQSQKPNLEQNPKTQRALIQKLKKEAEKAVLRNDIKDQIIEAHGGEQPANLGTLVNRSMKQYENKPQVLEQENQKVQQQEQQQSEEESPLATAGRGILRTGSRVGEAVLGAPGDIANLALTGADYLSGGNIPGVKKVKEYLPTSEKLKNITSKISDGLTDPQGGVEEFFDNIVSTASSLLAPSRAVGPLSKIFKNLGATEKVANTAAKVALPFSGITMSIPKAIGASAAGELASTGAEMLGSGSVGQVGAKIAAMTIAGKKSMKDLQKAEFASAKEAFKNNTTNTENMTNNIFRQEKLLKGRALTEDVKNVMREVHSSLEPLLEKSLENGGKLAVNDIIQARQDLSNVLSRTGYEAFKGQAYLPESARPLIKNILKELDSTISHASETNLRGGKAYAIANDLTRSIGAFNKAELWIPAHMPKNIPGIVYKLFKGGHEKLGATKDFFTKYPKARDAYVKALGYAAKENSQAFAREVAHISKMVEEEK